MGAGGSNFNTPLQASYGGFLDITGKVTIKAAASTAYFDSLATSTIRMWSGGGGPTLNVDFVGPITLAGYLMWARQLGYAAFINVSITNSSGTITGNLTNRRLAQGNGVTLVSSVTSSVGFLGTDTTATGGQNIGTI